MRLSADMWLGWLMACVVACACAGCSKPAYIHVDDCLAAASEAIADEDYVRAQQLCDDMLSMIGSADSIRFGEASAGRLGILYMRLSEHRNEDENIADATQCIRYAFRQSADSLTAFSVGLPLDDVRHFVLLRRIGLSIDCPVDLTDRDMTHPD